MVRVFIATLFISCAQFITTIEDKDTQERYDNKQLNQERLSDLTPKTIIPVIPVYHSDDISDSLFYLIMEHIKDCESFRDSIYIDTDGSPSIGYGHHIRKGESFTKITEEEATNLLKADFKIRVEKTKKHYNLDGAKAYAIALFVYNCGSGTYSRSELKKAVDNGEPIDEIIIQYCNYRKDGIYHFSSGLLERRQFELEIYNS